MPVKRRTAKAREHRITLEAVTAFVAGDHAELHRALGLAPWCVSPLDVTDDKSSPWSIGAAGAATWEAAQQLRRELERASEN